MKKALPWMIIAITVIALAALFIFVLSPMSEDEFPQNNESGQQNTENEAEHPKAEDFTVYDYDGNKVPLSSMRGKVTVVNFWATWCGYCLVEMPDFELAYNDYKDEVNFMMVNLTNGTETVDKAKSYIDEQGYSFPIYYDTALSAYTAYTLTSIPRTLIIMPDGTLMREYVGAMDKVSLYSLIEADKKRVSHYNHYIPFYRQLQYAKKKSDLAEYFEMKCAARSDLIFIY